MCFSATASFAAASGLTLIGVAAMSQSRTNPQRVFACIPLVFGIQQFCEGMVWLTIHEDRFANFHEATMYSYLVFAEAVWPLLIPYSIILFEKEPKRKKILWILRAVGLLTAVYLICCLFIFPVSVTVGHHHLQYQLDFPPAMKWFTDIGYMAAAALSPFVSSDKRVRVFGWMLLSSYILTTIFYQQYLASVWCYFAAVLSFSILLIIHVQNKAQR